MNDIDTIAAHLRLVNRKMGRGGSVLSLIVQDGQILFGSHGLRRRQARSRSSV